MGESIAAIAAMSNVLKAQQHEVERLQGEMSGLQARNQALEAENHLLKVSPNRGESTLRTFSRCANNNITTVPTWRSVLTFLNLPPEIRKTIYELSLMKGKVFPRPRRLGDDLYKDLRMYEPPNWNLLAASRQIRSEAGPILFAQNYFVLAYDEPFALKGLFRGQAPWEDFAGSVSFRSQNGVFRLAEPEKTLEHAEVNPYHVLACRRTCAGMRAQKLAFQTMSLLFYCHASSVGLTFDTQSFHFNAFPDTILMTIYDQPADAFKDVHEVMFEDEYTEDQREQILAGFWHRACQLLAEASFVEISLENCFYIDEPSQWWPHINESIKKLYQHSKSSKDVEVITDSTLASQEERVKLGELAEAAKHLDTARYRFKRARTSRWVFLDYADLCTGPRSCGIDQDEHL